MRVFCPSCQEPVTIADDLAGQATFCPLCKAAFTAPALFGSSAGTAPGPVSTPPPAPIPSLSLEPEPKPAATPPAAPTPPPPLSPARPPEPPKIAAASSSHARSCSCSLSPEVIQWLAPVCLGLALVLSVCSWNGAYPGGHAVYTQSGWGALFGGFSSDPVGEKILQLNPEKVPEGGTRLRDHVHSNLLMLPCLFLLLGTFVLAVGFTIYPRLNVKLPSQVAPMMPFRMALVAAFSLLVLLILLLQMLRGFGLENALIEDAKQKVKVKLSDNPTTEEVKMQEIDEGMHVGRLNVRHTTWLCLTVTFLIVAILSALATFFMTRRTDRPHPRVEILW